MNTCMVEVVSRQVEEETYTCKLVVVVMNTCMVSWVVGVEICTCKLGEEVTCTCKLVVGEIGTYIPVEEVTCTCKPVVVERRICMASLVVVVVNYNGKVEVGSALVVVESGSSKALVVVEMNRCNCLLKFGMGS